ncbi:hypothetical protein C8J57DRAFT_1304646 [Mycena rebaudengoi]|nr:hypothetical protein C8J57DRAFT_1304646 [Mycena rebaudengoi]
MGWQRHRHQGRGDVKRGWGVGGAEEGAKGEGHIRRCVIREASLESQMWLPALPAASPPAACSSSPVRAYGTRQCCLKASTSYASAFPHPYHSPALYHHFVIPHVMKQRPLVDERAGLKPKRKRGRLSLESIRGAWWRGPVKEVDQLRERQRRSRRGRMTLSSVGGGKESAGTRCCGNRMQGPSTEPSRNGWGDKEGGARDSRADGTTRKARTHAIRAEIPQGDRERRAPVIPNHCDRQK